MVNWRGVLQLENGVLTVENSSISGHKRTYLLVERENIYKKCQGFHHEQEKLLLYLRNLDFEVTLV